MEYEIRFQDLVSYVVPGAAAVLLSYWLVRGFVGLNYPVAAGNLGTLLVFLIFSYVLGQVMQALGNILESRYEKRWGGKYSDQLLRDSDSYYSAAFRTQLKQRIQDVFGLPIANENAAEATTQGSGAESQTHLHYEAFHLCHALVLQEDVGQQAEIFQGLYALYRGLLAFGVVGMVASLIFAIKEMVLLILGHYAISLPKDAFFAYDKSQLIASSSLLVILLVTRPLFYSRLKRFSRHYYSAVYRGFFAWSAKRALLGISDQELEGQRSMITRATPWT